MGQPIAPFQRPSLFAYRSWRPHDHQWYQVARLTDIDLAEFIKAWLNEHVVIFYLLNDDHQYQSIDDFVDHSGKYECSVEGEFDVLKLARAIQEQTNESELPA